MQFSLHFIFVYSVVLQDSAWTSIACLYLYWCCASASHSCVHMGSAWFCHWTNTYTSTN